MKQRKSDFVWKRKHLLGLRSLRREEIEHILDTAEGFEQISARAVKKAPALRGKVMVNLFFEDSTRTRSIMVNRGRVIRFTRLEQET